MAKLIAIQPDYVRTYEDGEVLPIVTPEDLIKLATAAAVLTGSNTSDLVLAWDADGGTVSLNADLPEFDDE